jgi:hypothetical protein
MWAKINLPTTERRQRKALAGYIECEKEVRAADDRWLSDDSLVTCFRRVSLLLWGDILSAVDRDVYRGEIIPNHSSGSTADSLSSNGKWDQREWTVRLDNVFPLWENIMPNLRSAGDGVAEGSQDPGSSIITQLLEPGQERPVKVILVPKTLKTPRVIAMEPTCMQYMQQGLLQALTREASKKRTAWKLLGWDSQVPNQALAQVASRKRSHATLDLSEASDRVSNQLVRLMLAHHPHLREAVDACRSRKADVPGFGVQRLAKFASMGSALTFPVESMIFTTIIFMAVQQVHSRPLTRKDIKSLARQVRVYGDDLIVPVRYVPATITLLETFGLKVNVNKSFWNGKFRESCGGDYYDGDDVSIVRVRSLLPTCRKNVLEIASTVSLRNQLYNAGLWKTVRYLDDLIGGLIPFPVVLETSPALGRHSFLGFASERMSPTLHRPQVRAYTLKGIPPVSRLNGYGALLKCLLPYRDLPFPDAEHLERSGRPKSVNMRLGWVNSF